MCGLMYICKRWWEGVKASAGSVRLRLQLRWVAFGVWLASAVIVSSGVYMTSGAEDDHRCVDSLKYVGVATNVGRRQGVRRCGSVLSCVDEPRCGGWP